MANKLTEVQQQLSRFIQTQGLSQHLHSPPYISGLVFAVAASPEIPMPMTWLPWVFRGDAKPLSEAQSEALMELLLTLLRTHLDNMRSERLLLPKECEFCESMLNGEQGFLTRWMSGLTHGHQLLQQAWAQAWDGRDNGQGNRDLSADLSHALKMFSHFANPALTLSQADEARGAILRDKFAQIALSLPRALQAYVRVSGELAKSMPNQFETFVKQP